MKHLMCVAKYGKIYVVTDVFNHQMSSFKHS